MAKISSKNAIILINGYNFSTYATMFDVKMGAGKVEVSGFGDGSKNYIPGLQAASIDAAMLWESSANSVHLAMKSMPTGIATILPEGWVLGAPTFSLQNMQGNYAPKGKPAGALEIGTILFESNGVNSGVEGGVALQHGVITNTLTGTGFIDPTGGDVTAICAGALHVWTPTSTDTYVVKIQHSTTLGSGYTDLITFVSTGTTRTAERVAVASGTIHQYRRIVATRTGSGDNFGFSVHFWHA